MNKITIYKKTGVILLTIVILLLVSTLIKAEQKNQDTINIKEVEKAIQRENKVDIIVWLKKGTPEELISNLKDFETKYIYQNGFAGKVDYKTFKQLIKDSRVNYIVLDKPVKAHLQQSRPLIRANFVESSLNITGRNIGVCILDTGMNYSNQYLSASYIGGYDFVNNDPFPLDDNGHGTKVAGIIASRHSSTGRGIAPGSEIVAVKVLDSSATGY